jgi:hypothetical protein
MEEQKVTYTGPSSIDLRSKAMDLEYGWLGRCFGNARNAPVNIAGLTVVLLLGTGVAMLFFESKNMLSSDYWKLITPILTLILGYLFGKKSA